MMMLKQTHHRVHPFILLFTIFYRQICFLTLSVISNRTFIPSIFRAMAATAATTRRQTHTIGALSRQFLIRHRYLFFTGVVLFVVDAACSLYLLGNNVSENISDFYQTTSNCVVRELLKHYGKIFVY
jgi:hypothetical protein